LQKSRIKKTKLWKNLEKKDFNDFFEKIGTLILEIYILNKGTCKYRKTTAKCSRLPKWQQ